ncbi:MAG: TerB N-terminal domain-containing protein [Eubacteriales bacterium]
MNENGKTDKERLDDFWKLDDLIPDKKRSKYIDSTPREVHPTLVDSPEKEVSSENLFSDSPLTGNAGGTLVRRYISSEGAAPAAPAPEYEYEPENSLIHRVRIYTWQSKYRYYEQFCREAESLSEREGTPCGRVPFFSYVPQYDQLNRDQLAYYLWWRMCAERGEYIDADYSYILLYAFEVINLPPSRDAALLRDRLCGVWTAYRKKYPKLDRLFSEWIFDFCMINRLPAPSVDFPDLDISYSCGPAEFFVKTSGKDAGAYASALLTHCSSYNYKKSKFYTVENAALYDGFIERALVCSLEAMSAGGKLLGGLVSCDSRAGREAYAGALCSYKNKKRIEIEFCSFSRSHELRFLIGDVVKYSENKLRTCLGIKSKLTVFSLNAEITALIDSLAESMLPKRKRTERSAAEDEFEKNYAVPLRPLSLERAKEIEDESWETTRSLVEAFEDDGGDEPSEKCSPETVPAKIGEDLTVPRPDGSHVTDMDISHVADISPVTEAFRTAESPHSGDGFGELTGYLLAVLNSDTATQAAECARLGCMPESAADRINERAIELFGDIIIEDCDGSPVIIEEYRSEVADMCR